MSGKRILAAAVIVASLGAATGALAAWRSFGPYAHVGVVYLAEHYCACRFVAERGEASCRAEFQPDIASFKVETRLGEGGGPKAIVTHLGWLSGRAVYEPAYGCRITR